MWAGGFIASTAVLRDMFKANVRVSWASGVCADSWLCQADYITVASGAPALQPMSSTYSRRLTVGECIDRLLTDVAARVWLGTLMSVSAQYKMPASITMQPDGSFRMPFQDSVKRIINMTFTAGACETDVIPTTLSAFRAAFHATAEPPSFKRIVRLCDVM